MRDVEAIEALRLHGGPQFGQVLAAELWAAMKAQGLDGFYIPHEDEYQNEYLPASNDRLAWATGF
ncbi:MAG: hypothetical protein RLN72_03225, partial [Henriciella sp.]